MGRQSEGACWERMGPVGRVGFAQGEPVAGCVDGLDTNCTLSAPRPRARQTPNCRPLCSASTRPGDPVASFASLPLHNLEVPAPRSISCSSATKTAAARMRQGRKKKIGTGRQAEAFSPSRSASPAPFRGERLQGSRRPFDPAIQLLSCTAHARRASNALRPAPRISRCRHGRPPLKRTETR